eukprot:5987422-Pleurochrysis_carterae.AAC.5
MFKLSFVIKDGGAELSVTSLNVPRQAQMTRNVHQMNRLCHNPATTAALRAKPDCLVARKQETNQEPRLGAMLSAVVALLVRGRRLRGRGCTMQPNAGVWQNV